AGQTAALAPIRQDGELCASRSLARVNNSHPMKHWRGLRLSLGFIVKYGSAWNQSPRLRERSDAKPSLLSRQCRFRSLTTFRWRQPYLIPSPTLLPSPQLAGPSPASLIFGRASGRSPEETNAGSRSL